MTTESNSHNENIVDAGKNAQSSVEKMVSKATSKPIVEEAEVSEVTSETDNANAQQSKKPWGPLCALIGLVWLSALTYLQFMPAEEIKSSLTDYEVVLYPFGEVNRQLKQQGYDFDAIQAYNRNMLAILNAQGKVVIPKATVYGDVPNEVVVELISVEEMNQMASE